MGLQRAFVGFSSIDIRYYYLMLAWKENSHIDFNFANCQLQDEISSEDEAYIKRLCRQRITLASTYILLIGDNTRYKHKYVLWEAQVAAEKGCTIIGVNLDMSRQVTDKCPSTIRNIGAIFVPFSPAIVAFAMQHYEMHTNGNWYYEPKIY